MRSAAALARLVHQIQTDHQLFRTSADSIAEFLEDVHDRNSAIRGNLRSAFPHPNIIESSLLLWSGLCTQVLQTTRQLLQYLRTD